MAFPFRQPVNTENSPDDEEDWSPPSYATPVKSSSSDSSDEEWKPPSYATAVKKTEIKKPGILSRVKDYLTKPSAFDVTKALPAQLKQLADEHPKIVEAGRRLLFGDEKDTEGHPIQGPGMSEVPGVKQAAEYVRAKGRASGDYWKGFGASVAGDVLDFAATGFDPRTAGIKTGEIPYTTGRPPDLPIRQASREIPYRMGEPNALASTGIEPPVRQPLPSEFTTPAEAAKTVPPPVEARNKEDILYDIAKKKFQMGQEQPKAEFLGLDQEKTPYYNIVEADGTRRTFRGPDELTKRGIEIPETPEDAIPLKGDDLRAKMLAERKGEKWTPPDYAKPQAPQVVNPFEPQASRPKPGEGIGPSLGLSSERYISHHSQFAEDILGPPRGDLFDVANEPKQIGSGKTWEPPDYAKPSEEPQAARTESGKIAIGADIKSLGKVLGTSLYKGNIAPIATKELLQNSIDAVRHLGTEGKIDVTFDRPNNTIHVSDNGKGLTRQELESVFTDLGASGKREDTSAAGGFGLAKAAPLLGGERAEVTSISKDLNGKLHKYSFSGSPNELLEGVDIKHEIPPEGTPTGTTVKVKVPKDSEFYGAKEFVNKLSKHSPNVQSKIRVANMYSGDSKPMFSDVPKGEGKSIATLDNPSATTELIESGDSTRGTRSSMDLHLSNNGMYQKTIPYYFDSEVPNVPSDLVVDIRSKVPEGHGDYPFTANREELRGTVDKQVRQYIDDNIVKPSVGKRLDELKKLYEGMDEMSIGKGEFPNNFGKKVSLYDPKGQITPGEMQSLKENPAFHTLAENITSVLDEALKVQANQSWSNRLEKTGIIFDDKLHGIHIPNPGSGKSAILVNPFLSIDKMSPDEASANILHTILHEIAHIEPEARAGHNESFTIRLGEVYAKYGARRSVEAQDAILNAISNPDTGRYNPEIQEILSTYKASRGREGTTEDLLSGTGIGSRPKGRGEGSIPPNDRPDGEGTTAAVRKLLDSLGEAKSLNEEQQAINRSERARRFADFASVRQEGAAGAAKSLGKLRGEFDKVEPGQGLAGLSSKETDSLFTAIKRANITNGEKARGFTALFKLMNGEGVPVRSELQVLDHVFGNGFGDKVIQMHGGIGAVGLKVSKLANTMKSIDNSMSLAAPLRHGIGLAARKEFYPAFVDMFKFFASKDAFDAEMKAIEEHPRYLQSREAGLFLPKLASGADEEFLNSYVGNIPRATGIPAMVSASKRAYTGFLNKLKFDTFKNMTNRAEDLGYKLFTDITEDDPTGTASRQAKGIANFINTFTGRGDLGRLNKMTNELNLLLWSPRMIASRVQMFTSPKLYVDLPKEMRMEGLKGLLAIASLGTIIDTAAAMGGAKISTNILSTDFGKSRFGTKLIDPWGGFQQYVVGAARFLAGKTDSSQPTSRLDIAGRFLANKESPAASLAHTLLTAKKFTGKSDNIGDYTGPFTDQYNQKTSVSAEVAKRFVPIFVQDLYDLYQSETDFSSEIGLDTAMAGASLAGMAQQYPERKKGLMLRKPRLR